MAAALIPDALWDLVEPLLSIPSPRPNGGRPRVRGRACLTGILFVLRSAIPWQMLPQELGCGSGMTCWRRLRDWQQAGIWDLIHFALLDWLARQDPIDWSRAVVDSCSVRAVYGGAPTGPDPRSLPRARVCADLLAVFAKALDDRLSGFSFAASGFVVRISLDSCSCLPAGASVPTKSSRRSVRAAWGRSIVPATRS
jgi:transposase